MKQQTPAQPAYTGSLVILTSLFFMWGFITCLNDILIPHLKAVFTLSYSEAMLIQFCFFTAYFLVSVPSGYLVEKIGYKNGIILGLLVAGCGCLLFYPAAGYRCYALFLMAFFILAAGITLLQVSANPYVTALGKADSAASRLTLTQAFNALGTTIAPYFGALFILSGAVKTADDINLLNAEELLAYQTAEAATVQIPYLGLMALLLLMAAVFARLKLPVIASQGLKSGSTASDSQPSAWHYPHLVLGALAIFVYVGGEVAIGSFLVSFLGEPSIADLPPAQAGKYVTFYWGGAMLGRFAGAAIMQKVSAVKVLRFNAIAAASLVILSLCSEGPIAMWSLLAVGLCNSIMFPGIFSLAVSGLGVHAGQGSGILCSAIVGGALIPLLQGVLADQIGIHQAFWLPVLCYSYIGYYAWRYPALLAAGKA